MTEEVRSIKTVFKKGLRPSDRVDMHASDMQLTSLDGAPPTVKNNFHCNHNNLTSLVGGPTKVGGVYDAAHNQLTSLEGAPEEVNEFNCANNQLKTLQGAPKKVGYDFFFGFNPLTSLEGSPIEVIGRYSCYHNKLLTNLKGIHKHIKTIKGTATFEGCPLTSHVLGLMKIEGLQRVEFNNALDGVEKIINKHLKGERNIFDCQAELEDAGFEEFAQL